MSRAFVVNDQGYDASPRVYVNNMNTAQATVNLPDRRPNSNNMNGMPMRGMDAVNGGGGDATCGGNFTGAHIQANRGAAEGGRSILHNGDALAPTTAKGEPVHANLQDVYDRIMRRLQRQMNYAELSRATLAEQYGVDMELQDEEDAAAAGEAASEGVGCDRRRVGSSVALADRSVPFKNDNDGALSDAGRSPSQSLSCPGTKNQGRAFSTTDEASMGTSNPKDSSRHGSRSTNGGGEANGAGTSRLLQFKQQQLPAASQSTGVEERSAAGGVRSDADVERDLDEQPCPRPLRLVVGHVFETLLKKMTLAENGSLRDCIVFSFEARALLDRLLKEIPLYTQYTAYPQASSLSMGNAVAQQAVTGVYQQLRKRPVLLPRGEYVEEATTGAIRAKLVTSRADTKGGSMSALPGGGGGRGTDSLTATATRLPGINVLPVSSSNSTGGGGGVFGGPAVNYSTAMHAQSPDIPLPASYGKSARLTGIQAQNSNTPTSLLPPSQPQRSFRRTVMRDRPSNANGSVSLAGDSFGDVSELATSGHVDGQAGAGAGGTMVHAHALSEAAAAHRATQLVSVGTITEDNSATTVPQAEYAALQLKVEELETQLAEAQQHRGALAKQLCEEEQYTDQKKRIVQYLRETLVRECNMLRAQLHRVTTTTAATPSRLPSLQAGKLGHTQRGGLASMSLHKDCLASTVGGNASVHGGGRSAKPSNGTRLSSSVVMGASDLPLLPHKSSMEQPSISGSLSSMHGENFSETTNGRGGGGGNATTTAGRSVGRHTPQLRLGGGGGGGVGTTKPTVGYAASVPGRLLGGRHDASKAEVDAVHSLLDLVLLAVEEEAVLPPHTAQLIRQGHGDTEVLHHNFRKNAKQQLDELRVEFEERQQAMKKTLLQQTAEHNYMAAEQHAEVLRLRALTDTTHVRRVLQDSVSQVRAELSRFRMHVKEQLQFFKAILYSTGQGLLHRATLVDNTMSDNVTLSSTLNATKELIESANSLLLPMLTREYECGYHPWPLKVRNTRDPLGHVVQLRFGTTEVVRLRDPLSEFGKLYVAIHQYVMAHAVLPESARPTTGKPLEGLCAALALNPTSHTDVVFAARRCHDVEGQLRKKLARLQARILWNTYRQRVYTDRSMAALAEAGIDLRVATLPVARRLNALAQQRGDLLQARVKIQRERSENAKEVYRLWREKEIDIMEGYPVPQTQRNRLALLSNNGKLGDGGDAVMQANKRTALLPIAMKRASADYDTTAISF